MARGRVVEETPEEFPIRTDCEYVVLVGENLPNHSQSMAGRAAYVRITTQNPREPHALVRTRQEAYRLAAHLLCTAQVLPDEELPSTFQDIFAAVQESTEIFVDQDVDEV